MKKAKFFPIIGFLLPAVIFFMLAFSACAPRPQGAILIYEVDPKSVADGETVDREELAKAVERRLNSGSEKLARVQTLDDGRIEVVLLRRNEADRQQVERLLARTDTTLEFRILANRRDDKPVIERALADPSKDRIHDSNGALLAWWVPVETGEEQNFTNDPKIAQRMEKNEGREVMEIMVVKDPYDVTGAYITRAEPGTDSRGKPNVHFTFNNDGGKRFGNLTSSHLPDEKTDFYYRLGIILNGELYSAPRINAVIFDRGEISGSFTKEEVQELAKVLNGGTLPVRLRLVETKSPP